MAAVAVEFSGVSKDYRLGWAGLRVRALERLTLQVAAGEVLGLLGPNGSGKSTALHIVVGLVRPSAGTCTVFGQEAGTPAARARVVYVPDNGGVADHLTGRETLRRWARLDGLGGKEAEKRIEGALEQIGLTGAADRGVATYSRGMRQRLGLGQVLMGEPAVLVLDEPWSAVDPVGVRQLTEVLRALRRSGRTVILTSHLLGRVEDLCDRVVMLDRGRIVKSGSPSVLLGPGPGECRRGWDDVFVEAIAENKTGGKER